MHIKKIQKVSEASPRKFRQDPSTRGLGKKWGPADVEGPFKAKHASGVRDAAQFNEEEDFHHVTESERQRAQDLWNKYNDDLEAMGLQLMYDYGNGVFYVCSTDLVRDGEGKRDLTRDELETVTSEGEFDRKAKNNPPWFTGGDYTLAIK